MQLQHEKQSTMNVEDYVSWVLAGVASVIATLATAVASLWKINEARNSRQIEELKADVKDCKDDREMIRNRADELSDEVAGLKVRLAFLEHEEKTRNGHHE